MSSKTLQCFPPQPEDCAGWCREKGAGGGGGVHRVAISRLLCVLPACDASPWSTTALVPTVSGFPVVGNWSAEVFPLHFLERHVTQ